MSVRTKKHPIRQAEFTLDGYDYAIPWNVMHQYRVKDEETYTVDEVFSDLYEKYGKPALYLKGLRLREELTQKEFAKKIGVTQILFQ